MKGPDQKFSLDPNELTELVHGCRAIKEALGDKKIILNKEKPILRFARESVVSIKPILKGEIFTEQNISTKRPGTGAIPASKFYQVIEKKAIHNISTNKQLSWHDIQ